MRAEVRSRGPLHEDVGPQCLAGDSDLSFDLHRDFRGHGAIAIYPTPNRGRVLAELRRKLLASNPVDLAVPDQGLAGFLSSH